MGCSKPDKRIFELALNKLNLQPENTLFVGDDLEKDIAGPQNANIKGVWFNPQKIKNTTKIQPYAEINTLDSLLSYVTLQYFITSKSNSIYIYLKIQKEKLSLISLTVLVIKIDIYNKNRGHFNSCG